MSFETNRFCWHGCISTDPKAAQSFYTKVLGWSVSKEPMGDDTATFFAAGGANLAHLSAPPMEGIPSHWSSFLRVDNVDTSAAAAVTNGGKLLSPAMDIPPGRFCTVASPSGAPFMLFHEADPGTEHHPGGEGGVHWVELHSKDTEADLAWLVSTFGFATEQMEMPQGQYTVLKIGDNARGGVMAGMDENVPSHWLVWIAVADIDQALGRAAEQGGTVISSAFDIPGVGRLGVIQDPANGVIGLISPS